ncbi:MAG: hypothetical protein ASARMPREDX12_004343 [Alectoria sarmentosa]|nr:MAG: hypothetical protein ASARMPREDX12_004343 [Alectoria sarmentosa]
MKRWTIEEEMVVVYYASRYVKHATIVDILSKKCPPRVRTPKQVTSKVLRLRIASGQKEVVEGTGASQNRGWDRKLADQWLLSKMEKERLQELLEFDGETAAIIGENNDLDNFVDIMVLDDRKTAGHQESPGSRDPQNPQDPQDPQGPQDPQDPQDH